MTINTFMPTAAAVMPANHAAAPAFLPFIASESTIAMSTTAMAASMWRRGIRVQAPLSVLVAHVAKQGSYVDDAKQAKGRPPRGMIT